MRVPLALALALVTSAAGLSGCVGVLDDGELAVGTSSGDTDTSPSAAEDIPLPDGDTYETEPWSRTLEEGPHEILPSATITIDGAGDVEIVAGVWKPDAVENGTEVPVIVDAGPYYGFYDAPVDEPAKRLGSFLVHNYVPHGYAVVQLSVRGTGQSDGCNDLLGPKEQADLDEAVTALGEADWSNGNVSLVGRSYDGTTPFEAATFGNDHLATIVPISGLSDVGNLYYRNGTSEVRAPILGTFYTTFGLRGDRTLEQRAEAFACTSTPKHPVYGTQGWATGGRDAYAADAPYWEARDYQDRILENYEGSVFMVHGLQDWNVDPHMAYPFVNQLTDAGIPTKVWAGQWEHNYPDRNHSHVREDWAETLLHWFDSELKGEDVDTGPTVETEDNRGNWRTAKHWPPKGTTDRTYYLGADGLAASPDAATEATRLLHDPAGEADDEAPAGPPTSLTFASDPLAEETRVVGLPTLHVDVTPTEPGGTLYAELHEVTAEGEEVLLGHASMDLRYHQGGTQQQEVVPGQRITAKMQLLPMDVLVQEGSKLKLTLEQNHDAFLPAPQQGPVEVHVGGDASPLTLPLGETGGVHHTIDGVDPGSTWR
jgi:predicted acyl esterase